MREGALAQAQVVDEKIASGQTYDAYTPYIWGLGVFLLFWFYPLYWHRN
jgi:hypothetical protein